MKQDVSSAKIIEYLKKWLKEGVDLIILKIIINLIICKTISLKELKYSKFSDFVKSIELYRKIFKNLD